MRVQEQRCVRLLAGTLAAAQAQAQATNHCAGVNSCKGQSACKSTSNACKGQNACKGKGYLELIKAECNKIPGTRFKP